LTQGKKLGAYCAVDLGQVGGRKPHSSMTRTKKKKDKLTASPRKKKVALLAVVGLGKRGRREQRENETKKTSRVFILGTG